MRDLLFAKKRICIFIKLFQTDAVADGNVMKMKVAFFFVGERLLCPEIDLSFDFLVEHPADLIIIADDKDPG
ncbi:MAG: hypothetical protein IJP92_11360 [Lachnospiraceae bacterium]|nr:hypothetical protein [Lachnospiraceae bacterium]